MLQRDEFHGEHENEENKKTNKEKTIESFSPFTLQTSAKVKVTVFVWLMYFDFIEVDFLPKHNAKPFDL